MTTTLEDKVAIVTGATRSMGAEIAARLADDGAHVACLGRSAARGEQVAAELRAQGKHARFIQADVSSEKSVTAAIEETVSEFGRLDIIVNNGAATDILRGDGGVPAVEETTKRFDRMMKVNVYGPFWLAKYGIPHMLAGGTGGAIVNISSISAHRVDHAMPSYSASKAALEGLTRQLAHDYAADGIRVNAVVLGSIASAETAYIHEDPTNGAARRANRMLAKPGTPTDVANLVAFLCSEDSRFMTAAMVPLDGGALSTYPAPVIATTRPH
jgi:NAD(P)-dependent dehydrogenase (short-subunit alcohol dehydrogenase family)